MTIRDNQATICRSKEVMHTGHTDRYHKKELEQIVVGGLKCNMRFNWGRDWENGMRARPDGNEGGKGETPEIKDQQLNNRNT